jgi:hypothetical protein
LMTPYSYDSQVTNNKSYENLTDREKIRSWMDELVKKGVIEPMISLPGALLFQRKENAAEWNAAPEMAVVSPGG